MSKMKNKKKIKDYFSVNNAQRNNFETNGNYFSFTYIIGK